MSWLKKLTSGLKKSSSALTGQLGGLIGRNKIDASTIEDLEDSLIAADLGVHAAQDIAEKLTAMRTKKPMDEDEVRVALGDLLLEKLSPIEQQLALRDTGLTVMLMVGVNGSGKTTTSGKIAARYADQGKKVLLAAADTFRAAAIEQLQGWAARSGVDVLAGQQGGDAAAIAYQALEKAQSEGYDLLVVDTAGRLQNRVELMDELAKIVRVLRKLDESVPHHSLLVLDGTVGQNALTQTKLFQPVAELTGLVMTKLDGSAKGGVLVALADAYDLPVHLVGVGEGRDDLLDFNAKAYAYALAGAEISEDTPL